LTERERTIDISTGLSVPQKYERLGNVRSPQPQRSKPSGPAIR
jgi:hypothetical protein